MSAEKPLVTFADTQKLGWVTKACLKSALHCGHRVHVYTYDDIANVPKGVSVIDASKVLPKSAIFKFDGISQPGQVGSLAPFSDALRYKLLKLGLGVWIDWDVYFIKKIDFSSEYILGWEGPRPFGSAFNPYGSMVGNAVMGIPANAPILDKLVDLTSPPYQMPPWLNPYLKFKVRQKLAGRPFHPGAVRYAEYGPIALNYYVKKFRMKPVVRDYEVHYPIDYRDVRLFLKNDSTFRDTLSDKTETIHLWHSAFRKVTDKRKLRKNSFAARLREESLDA
jgi:hypothetical protein